MSYRRGTANQAIALHSFAVITRKFGKAILWGMPVVDRQHVTSKNAENAVVDT